MSVKLPPDILLKLKAYEALLLKWQKAVNLVAPSTVDDAWNRHFEDSLQLVDLIPQSATSLIDIGSGAGFPGLVLALARPDLAVHLVESDQKKGTFLLNVSRETGAKNVNLHDQRIESVLPNLCGDVVTARALASLPLLLTLSRPQWERADRPATLLFLKGAEWQKEVDLARVGHEFELVVIPSKTNPDAAILCISAVREKKNP
ncbi:MAG: 16S rRNA (guanine(527)-N(7))-methyltransferase RsmG [Proteobacteria bacterium]|nr:16S rRNA (guanine(527)-N(7))-methyltransferase RsmG [Pseudomonadota bacterium]